MNVKTGLSDALDDLSSSRASLARRQRALDTLERMLAQTCACHGAKDQAELDAFLKLQDGFECNVASRLMHSIATWIPVLEQSATATNTENSTDPEELSTSRNTIQSLSVLQGIALLHPPSKDFLGKKWCIQIFIDILAVSRHLSPPPLSTSTNTVSAPPPAPTCSGTPTLASSSIDTLLCVLVDSPAAIRAFEEADGVEVVVKTLKRAGVARDIRIKCLEFLYFYLLDETGEVTLSSGSKHQTVPSQPSPRDPMPFPASATLHASIPPSRSPSPEVSPRKVPRNLGMLRKDVDFVPITPKKTQISRLGVSTPRVGQARTPRSMMSPTKQGRQSPVELMMTPASPTKRRVALERSVGELRSDENQGIRRKSTQEKKELLGSLLGNVESLVESVAKSGIWGLG